MSFRRLWSYTVKRQMRKLFLYFTMQRSGSAYIFLNDMHFPIICNNEFNATNSIRCKDENGKFHIGLWNCHVGTVGSCASCWQTRGKNNREYHEEWTDTDSFVNKEGCGKISSEAAISSNGLHSRPQNNISKIIFHAEREPRRFARVFANGKSPRNGRFAEKERICLLKVSFFFLVSTSILLGENMRG